jgi:hypothetical protein
MKGLPNLLEMLLCEKINSLQLILEFTIVK